MKSLLSCAKHLVNPLSATIKVESWCVAYVLCSVWTFINISIDEFKVLEFIAELAESWKDLAAYTTPTKHKDLVEFSITAFTGD